MLKLINTKGTIMNIFYGMSGGETVGTLGHQDKSNFAKFSFCRIRLNA